jgi:branched-chain amino acid transport system substrate-binding protein
MKTPLYMSHGVESKKFIELAGKENAEGILLPAGHLAVLDQVPAGAAGHKVLSAYRKGYQAKYGTDPSAFGGYAHDALRLVAEAAKLGKGATPEGIRAGLEKIRGFQGVTGEFNFSAADHNGLTEAAFVMVRISDGKFQLLDKITPAGKKAPAAKGGKKK